MKRSFYLFYILHSRLLKWSLRYWVPSGIPMLSFPRQECVRTTCLQLRDCFQLLSFSTHWSLFDLCYKLLLFCFGPNVTFSSMSLLWILEFCEKFCLFHPTNFRQMPDTEYMIRQNDRYDENMQMLDTCYTLALCENNGHL